MVDQSPAHLNALFHALADTTRREMLATLADGAEHTVSDLSAPHSMSLAAASKHLKVLERGGLVARRIEGRQHFLRLNPAALADANAWLRYHARFWAERLDALEDLLDSPGDKHR